MPRWNQTRQETVYIVQPSYWGKWIITGKGPSTSRSNNLQTRGPRALWLLYNIHGLADKLVMDIMPEDPASRLPLISRRWYFYQWARCTHTTQRFVALRWIRMDSSMCQVDHKVNFSFWCVFVKVVLINLILIWYRWRNWRNAVMHVIVTVQTPSYGWWVHGFTTNHY